MLNELQNAPGHSPGLLSFAMADDEIRMLPDISKSWVWVAAIDAFAAAGRPWAGRRSIKNLPEEWVRVVRCATPQGHQDTYFIAEPAVYALFAQSKTPKGQRFYRWIFADVLPNIRVNGFYGPLSPDAQLKIADKYLKCLQMMEGGSDAMVDAIYPLALTYARQLRVAIPPIEKFKSGQLELEGF